MSGSVFSPKIVRNAESGNDLSRIDSFQKMSRVEKVLERIASYIVIAMFALLPIFFIPTSHIALGFDKSLLGVLFVLTALIAIFLLALCLPRAKTVLPMSLGIFWLVVVVSFVSAAFSGDLNSSVRGSYLESTTAVFVLLLALTMTIPLVLQGAKKTTLWALGLFAVSSIVVMLYSLLRFLVGPDFLEFDRFSSITITPVGSLNDLAIFAALTILISIVTLLQLPIKLWMRYVIAILMLFSLIVLTVVNLTSVWWVLVFFSFLTLLYLLVRNSVFFTNDKAVRLSMPPVLTGVVVLIFATSLSFLIAGDYLGGKVNDAFGVAYLEVRPSFSTTVDIAKSVYSEDMLLGVGPNRFEDAWRYYKDPAINQTIYWDTDFQYGYGFVPTLFITHGLLGGLLIFLFHLMFLFLGYKMFIRNNKRDSYWYYFGIASFTGAAFIWSMTYVYVPGSAILLLGALFTGLTFAASRSLVPSIVRVIPLNLGRQRGFVLMAIVVVVVSVSVGGMVSVSKQYIAHSSFANALIEGVPSDDLIATAQNSYAMYSDASFAIAQVRQYIGNLGALLAIPQPTDEDQRAFLSTTELAMISAQDALKSDDTNPDAHVVLAGIYNVLALAQIDGAEERAKAAINQAIEQDPFNPGYHMVIAQMAVRTGNLDLAKTEVSKALVLKDNYTEALFLSAQIDIQEGENEAAIEKTRDIIALEPNNQTRYFQLGVLLASINDSAGAQTAFRRAVQLDPYYANARYLLALELIKSNQNEQALEQLKVVRETNIDNVELETLISKIESGEEIELPDLDFVPPVNEVEGGESFVDEILPNTEREDDLIRPLNAAPRNSRPIENVATEETEKVLDDIDVPQEVLSPEESATIDNVE